MRTHKYLASFLLVFLGAAACLAQSPDEIISKHIEAIGGKATLSKVNSIYMEGVASVMGNDLPTSVTILNGKGYKTKTTFNGMDIINCITDTAGWMLNPMQGGDNAVSLPAEMVKVGKSALDARGELYNFREKGYTDSLLGRDNVEGKQAYKIKLSQPGMEIFYFLDPDSYYILKMEVKLSIGGRDLDNITTYSNYKKTDAGIVLPYSSAMNTMGYDVQMNYTKIEVNKDIDTKVFMKP